MPLEGDGDEEPSWFVMQSTAAGSPALVGGPFAAKLRDGLNGAGKAKVWDPPIVDSMKVRFDSLRRYVADAVRNTQPVTQKSGGEKGESDVVLATISPIRTSAITITLEGTPDVVNGQATITSFDGAKTVHAITGRTTKVNLPPNHYSVEVTVDRHSLQPSETLGKPVAEAVQGPVKSSNAAGYGNHSGCSETRAVHRGRAERRWVGGHRPAPARTDFRVSTSARLVLSCRANDRVHVIEVLVEGAPAGRRQLVAGARRAPLEALAA